MNPPVKNWKAAAHGAVAAYHKLLEEKASLNDRLEAAAVAAERAGCDLDRRYNSDAAPEVPTETEAVACATAGCGAVVALTYDRRKWREKNPKADLFCRECREKGAAAAAADATEEKGAPRPDPQPGAYAEGSF